MITNCRPLGWLLFNTYVEQQTLKYDQNVLTLPGDATIMGYWQTERYFSDYSKLLREEISVREPISEKNRRWQKRILEDDSISVHVRRGDYVRLGWSLPKRYYQNAINRVYQQTGASSLYFFSDDIEWVKEHTKELLPDSGDLETHYVECNDGETAYEDLRLMRTCNHHIVANSSFSWWGAWLDTKDSKYVVAPIHWVHDSVYQLDIVPDRWEIVGW